MAKSKDPSLGPSLFVEEEAIDDPEFTLQIEAKVAALTTAIKGFEDVDPEPDNSSILDPGSLSATAVLKKVQHITPDEKSLSSISVNIGCPQGCPRTFANSSALRLHLKQVHRKSVNDAQTHAPGSTVWYHCPINSCLYNEKFGKDGKHFPKLKNLKQHYLKVHATRSHICECGQAYSTSALLAHHRRVCGLNLICVCGRSFSCFETLQTHARRMSHVIHPCTLQALRSRKISLSDSPLATSTFSSQDVLNHRLLRHPRLEDASKKDGGNGVTVSPSPTSASRSIPPAICPAPTTICPTPSTFTQVTSLDLGNPIHLLAAVALGEIAVTAMKRMPCVDVGIQTEGEIMRRSRRKSSSPGRWEPSGGHGGSTRNSSKRKRTTETQTRLTHRGSKKRNTGSRQHLDLPKVVPGDICKENPLEINSATSVSETSFLEVTTDDCNNDDNSLESLTLQVDLPELISSQSSLGTQTSPRAGGLTHSHLPSIAISLFDRACGNDEPIITPPSVTTITSTQTPQHLNPFAGSQLLLEEEEDLLRVVNSSPSALNGHHTLLTHIHSSSIETQTDHDVLLSENAGDPDEVDEIILTNTETQTDPSSLLNMSGGNPYEPTNPCQANVACDVSDSLWCTSETQTYEDFSDIEQFMRSTIHTQTPDHSHSELFPELSFTHTQTQTSIDDPRALVTTHTQTPTHTHFSADIY